MEATSKMTETKEAKTVSIVVRAIAALIGAKMLILKAIERSSQPRPEFANMSEALQALTQEIEVAAYAVEAEVLMCTTFGRDGRVRDEANKLLAQMVKEDAKPNHD